MKGLLYLFGINNKGGWLLTAVTFVVLAVMGASVMVQLQTDEGITGLAAILALTLPFVIGIFPGEIILRDIEKNLKSRFTAYTLAAMTREDFVKVELVKNLVALLMSVVLDLLMLLIFYVTGGSSLIDGSVVLGQIMMMVVGAALNWVAVVPTIIFKNQDIAGLVIGLPMGIAIGCAGVASIAAEEVAQVTMSILMWMFTLGGQIVFWAVTVGIYVLFSYLLLRKVKGGDVC